MAREFSELPHSAQPLGPLAMRPKPGLRLVVVALGTCCLSSVGCVGDETASGRGDSAELATWSVADAPTVIVDSEAPSPLHSASCRSGIVGRCSS